MFTNTDNLIAELARITCEEFYGAEPEAVEPVTVTPVVAVEIDADLPF